MGLVELPSPPPDFAERDLPIYVGGGPWYRLNPSQHTSALYFDSTGNGRFDSPHQGYGILYVGEDEYATFIECYGRTHGARGVLEAALRLRNLFQITATSALKVVDLTGSGLVKLGVDARLTTGDYAKARLWAKAIYEHPQQVDGIRYRSRHDAERICYGLFDRIQHQLQEENLGNLIDAHPPLLAAILRHYDYGLL